MRGDRKLKISDTRPWAECGNGHPLQGRLLAIRRELQSSCFRARGLASFVNFDARVDPIVPLQRRGPGCHLRLVRLSSSDDLEGARNKEVVKTFVLKPEPEVLDIGCCLLHGRVSQKTSGNCFGGE